MLAERGESEAIADRHAAAMLAWRARPRPSSWVRTSASWLDRLEREHDNMRAALDWAVARPDPALGAQLATALWRFWQQRGYLNEARRGIGSLEAQGWALEPIDRARFDEAFGGVAYWQSDAPTARRHYDEALQVWRELDDKREIANALFNELRGHDRHHGRQGPAPGAGSEVSTPLLDEALGIYRELGDAGGEGNILWALGSLHYFSASAADAESWYRRCARAASGGRQPLDGGVVAPHARPVGRRASGGTRMRARSSATLCATSTRPGMFPASPSSWTIWRSSRSASATSTVAAACGAPLGISSNARVPDSPTTSTRTIACSACRPRGDILAPTSCKRSPRRAPPCRSTRSSPMRSRCRPAPLRRRMWRSHRDRAALVRAPDDRAGRCGR